MLEAHSFCSLCFFSVYCACLEVLEFWLCIACIGVFLNDFIGTCYLRLFIFRPTVFLIPRSFVFPFLLHPLSSVRTDILIGNFVIFFPGVPSQRYLSSFVCALTYPRLDYFCNHWDVFWCILCLFFRFSIILSELPIHVNSQQLFNIGTQFLTREL